MSSAIRRRKIEKRCWISTVFIWSMMSEVRYLDSLYLSIKVVGSTRIRISIEINRDVNEYPCSTKENGKEEWYIPYAYFADVIKEQFSQ